MMVPPHSRSVISAVLCAYAALVIHAAAVFLEAGISGPFALSTVSAFFAALAFGCAGGWMAKLYRAHWREGTILFRNVFVGGLLMLLMGVAAFTALPGGPRCYPVADLGYHMRYRGRFRSWACAILALPPGKVPRAEPGTAYLADSLFPPWLRDANPSARVWGRIVDPHVTDPFFASARVRYVALGWDAGFSGWGLLLGPEELRLSSTPRYRVRQMASGVYRWD
jgi:hypothetical protein